MLDDKEYLELLREQKVRIKMAKEPLGLGLDEPLEKWKVLIRSGKHSFTRVSQDLNALFVFNKNRHPDVAAKAKNLRLSLSKWIEKERELKPDYGKE